MRSIFFVGVIVYSGGFSVSAETISGGGYVIQQTIAPVQGGLSGNGYVLEQSSQVSGDILTGGGHTIQPVFGSVATTSTPSPTPPATPGYGSSNSGGYFILPQATHNTVTYLATTTVVSSSTILTTNGTTCSARVAIGEPIDRGLSSNDINDIKKLEYFLNTYEHESLPVNGVYEKRDIDAVKRWQIKYRDSILKPMHLKNPTGTIYYWSIKQIDRQTTANCGEAIVVQSCPYFKPGLRFGDEGGEVRKIQQFLNIVQGEKIKVTGVYQTKTRDAVRRFQTRYKKDILSYLRLSFINGSWNPRTARKANEIIGCDVVE
jgi:Putative peptidoglycan binding domain